MTPPDLPRLREALAVWLPEYVAVLAERDDVLLAPLEDIEAAATAYADLLENGERVHVYGTRRDGRYIVRAFDYPASHVLVRLVPDPEEA